MKTTSALGATDQLSACFANARCRDWTDGQLSGSYEVTGADADDLVQEVLTVVSQELPKFKHNERAGAFRSWLRKILVNRLRNHWRDRQNSPPAKGGSSFLEQLNQLEDDASQLSQIWNAEHDRDVIAKLMALDVNREDARVRRRYGSGSLDAVDDGAPMHNEDFLIARRLVEAGARCVTISFGRWDTHSCRKAGDLAYKNNFVQLREYLPRLEQCLLALVDDLVERGLANDVSVVVWGEMGRTPRINTNGGRDHWPQVSGCILAGGGMRMGQVIGSTDRLAGVARDRPVHYQEVFATLYRQLGIDVARVKLPDLSGRPQYLLEH